MGVLRFVRDVVCAPYSIPIGLINTGRPLSMCSETTKKELQLKEVSTTDRAYSGSVGTQTEDVTSMTNYEILNQAIQDILRKNTNIHNVSINTANTANIDCSQLIVPLDVDPNMSYDSKLRSITENKINEDGSVRKLPVFSPDCCPVVEQIATITVEKWDQITETDIEEIYTEVDLNIENTLMEQGGESVIGTEASVLSSMNIQSVVKQKIREVITNATNQNVNIEQTLNYTDRYQRCEHFMENGEWFYRPKVLKQFITVETLSKNIINSTNTLVMQNQNKIDSTTKTVVNRITNYRVIVLSLLLNIVICYAIFKMFMNMLGKM